MVNKPSFDEIIGQVKIKNVCKTLLKFAKEKDTNLPHIAFSGNSGNGKTSFALAISRELDTNLFAVNGATVRDKRSLLKIIDTINHRDILFIDEIHSLPKKAIESMYTIMEDNYYYDDYGKVIKTPKFTIIGASNEIGRLPAPMKSRFQYIAEFEDYTHEELVDICHLVCKKQGFKLTKDMAGVLAKTCRGIPRIVKNRSQFVYQYMVANEIKTINREGLLEILAFQGVDQYGLETMDYNYIKAVGTSTLSIDTIASKISMNTATIKYDLEPWLCKQNLLNISKAGRSLTNKGLKIWNNL